MTAPGRTVAGISASGSRVVVEGLATVDVSLMHRRVSMRGPVASVVDTESTQLCCVAANARASSQLTASARSFRYGITNRGALVPEHAPEPIAPAVQGQPTRALGAADDHRDLVVARPSPSGRGTGSGACPGRSRRTAPARRASGSPPPTSPAGCGPPPRPARRRSSSARRASPRRTARSASGTTSPAAHTPGAGREGGVADHAVAHLQAGALQPRRSPAPRRCRRR